MMTPDSSKAPVPGAPPERPVASARPGARQGPPGEDVPAPSGFAAVMSDLGPQPPTAPTPAPGPDSPMASDAAAAAPASLGQPADGALENLLARWRDHDAPEDTPPLAREAMARLHGHDATSEVRDGATADPAAPQPASMTGSSPQPLSPSWLQAWTGTGSLTAQGPATASPTGPETGGSSPAPGADDEPTQPGLASPADRAATGVRAAVSVLRRETHFAPVRALTSHDQAFQQEMGEERAQAMGAASEGPGRQDPRRPADDLAGSAPSGSRALPAPDLPAAVGPVAPAMGGTGFTASLPFTSLAQVSDAITQEAAGLQSGLPSEGDATPAVGGPVRVLEMELSPETLGRVVIRLRLTGNGLDVKIRASSPDTARLLEQDRDHLARLLETRGVSLDGLQLEAAPSRGTPSLAQEPPASGQEREHARDNSQGRRDRDPPQPRPQDPFVQDSLDEDLPRPASGRDPLG